MILRTVIIDDEPLASDFLQMLPAEHKDIEVVAQCQKGQEAVSYLLRPNFVLVQNKCCGLGYGSIVRGVINSPSQPWSPDYSLEN
jgi:two-component system LytT family response regulator